MLLVRPVALLMALLLVGCQASQPIPIAGEPPPGAPLGSHLEGLTADQIEQFTRGRDKFSRLFSPATGLGPLFNDNSCRACHGAVASGGHSERTVRLAGAMVAGGPSLLEAHGGPMIQEHAIAGTAPEQVPAMASALSTRISPAVWGLGLVEAVPESALLAQMAPDARKLELGIRGIANWEGTAIGRFGAKAQKGDLKGFTEQAFNWELGISTPGRLEEPQPNGPPLRVSTPDISDAEVLDITTYQRLLAPPSRGVAPPEAALGAVEFERLGCALCHTPELTTGPNAFGIPENRPVRAYSDFLLHAMDPALADHMTQGAANGEMFRTAPLWGLRFRSKFMHDGRATTLDDAIRLHGGEAERVRGRYVGLSAADREALLSFLRSL